MITKAQLKAIMTNASNKDIDRFIDPLNITMNRFNINTVEQKAAFLATIAVESGELRYVRELGNDAYLSKYDTGKLASNLGNTPEADGDGQKYRGRGLIQITGRYNYEKFGRLLMLDLINKPELLEEPMNATLSAGLYWDSRNLNACSNDIVKVTKKVNGGTNHLTERTQFYQRAKTVLS